MTVQSNQKPFICRFIYRWSCFCGRWFFFLSSNVILSNQLINGIYTCHTPLGVSKCAILNICAYHCELWLNEAVRIENSNQKLKHPAETCRKRVHTEIHTSRRSPNKSNDFTLSCILNWASELWNRSPISFCRSKIKKISILMRKKNYCMRQKIPDSIKLDGLVFVFFSRVHLNNTL